MAEVSHIPLMKMHPILEDLRLQSNDVVIMSYDKLFAGNISRKSDFLGFVESSSENTSEGRRQKKKRISILGSFNWDMLKADCGLLKSG